MTLNRAAKQLRRRRKFLTERVKTLPEDAPCRRLDEDEIEALGVALKCMSILHSYGFVGLTNRGELRLKGQKEVDHAS